MEVSTRFDQAFVDFLGKQIDIFFKQIYLKPQLRFAWRHLMLFYGDKLSVFVVQKVKNLDKSWKLWRLRLRSWRTRFIRMGWCVQISISILCYFDLSIIHYQQIKCLQNY